MLLLLPVALASEIQVYTATPARVTVDGVTLEYPEGSLTLVAPDLGPGPHLVRAHTMSGRKVAEARVELGLDRRARLYFAGGGLTVVSEEPLGEEAQPRGDVELTPAPGSVEIAVRGPAAVDGRPIGWVAAREAWVAGGLAPGFHAVRVDGGPAVAVEVRPGENVRCAPVGGEVRCERGGSDLPNAPVTGRTLPSPKGPVVLVVPPEPPGPVEVQFLLKDHFALSNVYVDGERVAEFRTGDRKKSVTLPLGTHTVEIQDFTGFETWHRGTLTVTPGDTMKVGFGDDEPVEVYNRPAGWSGT